MCGTEKRGYRGPLPRWLISTFVATTLIVPATIAGAVGTWNVVPSPNPSGGSPNFLNAVAVVSPNDAWAVGEGGGQFLSLTEHWNGSTWSIVASPNLPFMTNLNGVAAIASNDVWAVGDNSEVGMTMHWNGSAWTAVANPATNSVNLNAASARATNDVWAVGSQSGKLLSLAMHWNGSAWSQISTPSPNSSENFLNGVMALASNNAWAVGQSGLQSFILHWNGVKWTRVSSPNVIAPGGYAEINALRSIAGVGANDLWAVGSAGASTLGMHWNGSAWSVVPTPNGPSYWNILSGVATVSSTDVWAVGFSYDQIDTCGEGCYQNLPNTLIEHWDGSAWSVVPSPSPVSGQSTLAGVAVGPSGPAWTVGAAGGQTLIEQNPAP